MSAPNAAFTIGLTGGIGSGKSTAAAHLQTLGGVLIDIDAISRQLTAPQGAAVDAVAAAFGPSMLQSPGELDRAKLRALIFQDERARRELEGILHPMIHREAWAQAQLHPGAVLVFDIPLLAESLRWQNAFDRVLVIDCDTAVQADRVAQRPGWTHELANRVIAQQATRDMRRAIADAIIDNSALSLEAFHQEIESVWASWAKGFRRPASSSAVKQCSPPAH